MSSSVRTSISSIVAGGRPDVREDECVRWRNGRHVSLRICNRPGQNSIKGITELPREIAGVENQRSPKTRYGRTGSTMEVGFALERYRRSVAEAKSDSAASGMLMNF